MNIRATLLAGAALLAIPAHADASQLRGTYVSVEAGASWIRDNRFFQEFDSTGSSSSYSYTEFLSTFETGWAVFGSVGYAFDNGIRTELELGYRHNKAMQDGTSSSIHSEGELREFTIMANALYDVGLTDNLSLSLGAGIGVDRARFTAQCLCVDEDAWTMAYQGIAGLNYALGSQTQFFINYRYLHVDAPDYRWFDSDAGSNNRVAFLSDLNKHAVTLGLRVAFSGDKPKPVAPPPAPPAPVAPPPPPPPPPPAAPEQFVVFFGYNKSNITSEAMQVIADAARVAKEFGAASILIVGHTDSSGSDKYNDALSQRRATAVKGALVTLGIEEGKISAVGRGESELIVKTGDGVKEPQNRRATIDLK